MDDVRLVVCVNERLGPEQKSCAGSGSRQLIEIMKKFFLKAELDIQITEQVCLGRCQEGIAMRIAQGGPFFTRVLRKDLGSIATALQKFKFDHML